MPSDDFGYKGPACRHTALVARAHVLSAATSMAPWVPETYVLRQRSLPDNERTQRWARADSDGAERELRARIIALTMVDGGSICTDENGFYGEGPYGSVVEVDRVEAGDAFAAGFLFGHLEGKDLAQCLRYARALSAIKYSIPGDLAITSREELESLVSRSAQEGIQR